MISLKSIGFSSLSLGSVGGGIIAAVSGISYKISTQYGLTNRLDSNKRVFIAKYFGNRIGSSTYEISTLKDKEYICEYQNKKYDNCQLSLVEVTASSPAITIDSVADNNSQSIKPITNTSKSNLNEDSWFKLVITAEKASDFAPSKTNDEIKILQKVDSNPVLFTLKWFLALKEDSYEVSQHKYLVVKTDSSTQDFVFYGDENNWMNNCLLTEKTTFIERNTDHKCKIMTFDQPTSPTITASSFTFQNLKTKTTDLQVQTISKDQYFLIEISNSNISNIKKTTPIYFYQVLDDDQVVKTKVTLQPIMHVWGALAFGDSSKNNPNIIFTPNSLIT